MFQSGFFDETVDPIINPNDARITALETSLNQVQLETLKKSEADTIFATKGELTNGLNEKIGMSALSPYAKLVDLPAPVNLTPYALKTDLPDISPLATRNELNNYALVSSIPSTSGLVQKEELDTVVLPRDIVVPNGNFNEGLETVVVFPILPNWTVAIENTSITVADLTNVGFLDPGTGQRIALTIVYRDATGRVRLTSNPISGLAPGYKHECFYSLMRQSLGLHTDEPKLTVSILDGSNSQVLQSNEVMGVDVSTTSFQLFGLSFLAPSSGSIKIDLFLSPRNYVQDWGGFWIGYVGLRRPVDLVTKNQLTPYATTAQLSSYATKTEVTNTYATKDNLVTAVIDGVNTSRAYTDTKAGEINVVMVPRFNTIRTWFNEDRATMNSMYGELKPTTAFLFPPNEMVPYDPL